MDKYTNDSNNLKLQNAAWQAHEYEMSLMQRNLDGEVSDEEYCSAMDATEMACEMAIKAGVSRKDLPWH